MSRIRINAALNAAKAITQGFDLNSSCQVKTVDLLYTNRTQFVERQEVDENDDFQVFSIQFNPLVNVIATGDSDGHIKLFDVFSGNPLENENTSLQQHDTDMPTMSIKWLENMLYFASSNGSIGCFNLETVCTTLLVKASDSTIRIYNLNGFEVVKLYTSANNYLAEHHTEKSDAVQTGSKNAHNNRLFSIKFDKNNQDVFYTGGWDRNVKIWDLRLKNGIVSTIYGNLNICADGIDVKDNFILTSSWVKTDSLLLWDVRSTRIPICSLPVENDIGQGEYMYAGKFSDYENQENGLVLACGAKIVHLIDYKNRQNLARLCTNSPLYCIDSALNGCLFACGSVNCFHVGITKP